MKTTNKVDRVEKGVAKQIGRVADALDRLGAGNACSDVGAAEFLAIAVKDTGRSIAEALSEGLERVADAEIEAGGAIIRAFRPTPSTGFKLMQDGVVLLRGEEAAVREIHRNLIGRHLEPEAHRKYCSEMSRSQGWENLKIGHLSIAKV